MDRNSETNKQSDGRASKLKLKRRNQSKDITENNKKAINPYQSSHTHTNVNKAGAKNVIDRSVKGYISATKGMKVQEDMVIKTEQGIPINSYKKSHQMMKRIRLKGILRKGADSHWWLTNTRRTVNYSKSFNGPTSNGEKLLLKWKVDKTKKVTWTSNQTIVFTPPENYDPWEYSYKMDSLVKCIKPYKY